MKDSQAYRAETNLIRQALAMGFPLCFTPPGEPKRPLKIGIADDMVKRVRIEFPMISRRMMKVFLREYCKDRDYHSCIRRGAVRVDLDGKFCGFISSEEATYSEKQIAKHEAWLKAAEDRRQRASAPKPVSAPAKPETLAEKLARLEHWHMLNGMSDNFYHSNGRHAEATAAIAAVKAQIEKDGPDAIA